MKKKNDRLKKCYKSMVSVAIAGFGMVVCLTPVYAGSAAVPEDAYIYENHAYKVYNESGSWNTASSRCKDKGGHLVTITTSGEQNAVSRLADAAGRNCYWIGAKRNSLSQWKWVTKEKFSYSNWAKGENDNYQNVQDSAFIFGNVGPGFNASPIGSWGDLKYDSSSWDNNEYWNQIHFGYICEWDFEPQSLSGASVTLSKSQYVYDGKAHKPSVTVKLNKKKLKKDTDYTVTYEENKEIGQAEVVITGIGKYNGSTKESFSIIPSKVTITKTQNVKTNRIFLVWKKVSKSSGYTVQYSTSKSFAEDVNTVEVSAKTVTTDDALRPKNEKTTYLSNLSKGKRYYIRIRAYGTGTGNYGAWSSVKNVKVTK